ncbi:hypothetical protein GH714_021301 [Hevea brasiliensis]|uniref:Reverse transcriptase Ty1/copia-type domain-containing protein n=1 Tax=Hevea brasiliensis TaxID=3981 RepID=A0A6A6NIC9_HEVBR|nr:hypothetical protein GH714_021301 [Hevea brasiliensis]
MKFDELSKWNWDKKEIKPVNQIETKRKLSQEGKVIATNPLEDENSNVENVHVRGTRAITDIYERYSDWAGSIDDFKSTLGYVFSFGSGVFSWNSKKQDVIAQSSAEAEYISAVGAANQAIWLRKILSDLGPVQREATVIFVDNKSAIAIIKNPV